MSEFFDGISNVCNDAILIANYLQFSEKKTLITGMVLHR